MAVCTAYLAASAAVGSDHHSHSSLDAAIALFLKPYTDVVVVGKDMSSPWYIPVLIVSFTTVQGLLNFLSAYASTWSAAG